MFRGLSIILVGLFFIATIFGPRLVLAESAPVMRSCHETSAEMPAACAIHCFSKAVYETEIEVVSAPSIEFIFSETENQSLVVPIFKIVFCPFSEEAVFRDQSVILTIIKRE